MISIYDGKIHKVWEDTAKFLIGIENPSPKTNSRQKIGIFSIHHQPVLVQWVISFNYLPCSRSALIFEWRTSESLYNLFLQFFYNLIFYFFYNLTFNFFLQSDFLIFLQSDFQIFFTIWFFNFFTIWFSNFLSAGLLRICTIWFWIFFLIRFSSSLSAELLRICTIWFCRASRVIFQFCKHSQAKGQHELCP